MVETYPTQYEWGVVVAAWRGGFAYVAPFWGKYCLYSLREKREVKCLDIPLPRCRQRGENCWVYGAPVWRSVSGSAVEAVYLTAFDGKAIAGRMVAKPTDISFEVLKEVPVNAWTGSTLDATFTWPRMWVKGEGAERNCVYLVDFEKGVATRVGCYGPGGYNIWPMTVWDKETELGPGRWLLSSHHYWIVGAFAYLHVIDRYRGQPSKSYTQYDSCSGSFSANDKLINGPWHGLSIVWGRSGGIGSNSCIHVFKVPFSVRVASFRNPIPDNPKSLLPLYADNSGYTVLEVHEHYGSRRGSARIMRMDSSGLRTVEELGNTWWNDHENYAHYYDPTTGEVVVVFVAGNKAHVIRHKGRGNYATGTSRSLPRYYLTNTGDIRVVAAGRLAGCEPEGQCEYVSGGATASPLPLLLIAGATSAFMSAFYSSR
jgi:hypothetical protein